MMSNTNLVTVLLILLTIHFLCSGVILMLIKAKLNTLKNGKKNRFTERQIIKLNQTQRLVILLPIIGSIIGFSAAHNVRPHHEDKGLRVNNSSDANSDQDLE